MPGLTKKRYYEYEAILFIIQSDKIHVQAHYTGFLEKSYVFVLYHFYH